MKYKLLLPTLAVCASSLFVAPVMADHEKSHAEASMQSAGEFRLSNLMGIKVQDSTGAKIGQVEDFVVDPNTGKIQFAVVKLSGDLAKGGAYTPIPWPMVAHAGANVDRSGGPQVLVLNVDRSKLASAQRFNVAHWPEKYSASMSPDKARPVTWGQDVYTYYGVPWQGAAVGAGATGTGSTVVTTGTVQPYDYQYQDNSKRSHYDKPIDNGTAPDGKDVFKFNPRPWPNSEYRTE
jgi:sporulation protein YlmC with PRC-barrel domain